jgi:hypothetical protein
MLMQLGKHNLFDLARFFCNFGLAGLRCAKRKGDAKAQARSCQGQARVLCGRPAAGWRRSSSIEERAAAGVPDELSALFQGNCWLPTGPTDGACGPLLPAVSEKRTCS